MNNCEVLRKLGFIDIETKEILLREYKRLVMKKIKGENNQEIKKYSFTSGEID